MVFGRKNKDQRQSNADARPEALPVVEPEKPRGPFDSFRLTENTFSYPVHHPQTKETWNYNGLILLYNPKNDAITLTDIREQDRPYKFALEDLPMSQWVQPSNHSGRRIPVKLRRDPMGVLAQWIPLGPEGW